MGQIKDLNLADLSTGQSGTRRVENARFLRKVSHVPNKRCTDGNQGFRRAITSLNSLNKSINHQASVTRSPIIALTRVVVILQKGGCILPNVTNPQNLAIVESNERRVVCLSVCLSVYFEHDLS
jgi:hypothetical protein